MHDQALRANTLLVNFQIVMELLMNFDTSRPGDCWNGSEARLNFFVDVLLRLVTKAGLHIAPEGHCLYEEDGEVPGDEHPKAEEEDVVKETEVDDLETPSEKRPSRKQAGTLNVHGLRFESEGLAGLLHDEPAKAIEMDITYIPDGVNGMGVDVEDEQGNKLIWDGNGKSHLVCAPTTDSTTTASTNQDESPNAKTPVNESESTLAIEAPPGPTVASAGFGFEYSDTEDGDENDYPNHVSEEEDGYDDSPLLSVAGGPMCPQPPTSAPSPLSVPQSPPSSLRKRKTLSPPSLSEEQEEYVIVPQVQRKRRKSSPQSPRTQVHSTAPKDPV